MKLIYCLFIFALGCTNPLGGQPGVSTNFLAGVVSGPYSLSQSVVTSGSANLAAASATTVFLQLRNAAGEAVADGSQVVTFSFAPGGNGVATFGAVTYAGAGIYSASLTGVTGGTARVVRAQIGASTFSSTATVLISPTLSVPSVLMNAGDTKTITIQLNATSTLPVTFNYVTHNGTATAGTHYTAVSGSGSISAGSLSTTVTLASLNDGNDYETKNLTLDLTGVTNAAATSATGNVSVSTPLADSVRDYSATDGSHSWYYGQYLTPLTYTHSSLSWNGSSWLGGDLYGTPVNSAVAQHPGCGSNGSDGKPIVRRWVNPSYSGTLTVRGAISKQNLGCGDGTLNTVVINGVVQYSLDLAAADGTGATYNLSNITTVAGDTIDLVTAPKTDCYCDMTNFNAQIFFAP